MPAAEAHSASTPAVSIVLPFHDESAHLGECLESIRAQTLDAWELLAIDDGSSDGSGGIIQSFAARDPRVRLLQPGRVGLVAALNLGIARARAPLLARMDADDVMHPGRLRAQHEYLDDRPDVALAGTQVELFPEDEVRGGYLEYVRWQNAVTEPEEVAREIYVESPFAHPSVMARTGVLRALGGYADGPFPEDYELWLRMHAAGHRTGKVPRVLLRWRERPGRTSRVDPRYGREAFDLLRAGYLARDPRVASGREVVVWGAGRRSRLRAAGDGARRPPRGVDRHRPAQDRAPRVGAARAPARVAGRPRAAPLHPGVREQPRRARPDLRTAGGDGVRRGR